MAHGDGITNPLETHVGVWDVFWGCCLCWAKKCKDWTHVGVDLNNRKNDYLQRIKEEWRTRGNSDWGDSIAELTVSERGIFWYKLGVFRRSYVDKQSNRNARNYRDESANMRTAIS